MARVRDMDVYRDIIHRLRQHQSIRAIHRDTSAHRTVIRKLKQIGETNGWLIPSNPMPENEALQIVFSEKREEKSDSKSALQPFFDQIKDWHLQGRSPTVICQLLKDRCATSPRSLQRFIKNHFPKAVDPIMLRENIPGEIADVDYGYLGIVYDPEKKRNRKAWVFSMRLRYSRRAYRQLSFDQSSKSFLMAHIHAFEFFGAVPEKVVLDNLKAGVIQANPFEPLLNKSYIALAEHYGFVISPCPPRTPQNKGGVENDIKYIKNNFWPFFCASQQEKGKDIPWAEELISALCFWGQKIADNRKVAGTDHTPEELFLKDFEKMKPLPSSRWDLVEWVATVVGLDWRVRYDNAFYSVPARLISQKVWICA